MAKKIKKTEIIKKCTNANMIKDFIQQENKKEPRKPRTRIDRSKPSTIPSLIHWKEKKLKDWCCTDFLGYYLNKYKEIVGEEDIQFVGLKSGYGFGKERGAIKKCLELFLENSNLELKKYIDFIIPWWISEDSWAKDLPNLFALFCSGAFVKIYKQTKFKTKNVTRSKVDNKFSNKEEWDKYFEEKGD